MSKQTLKSSLKWLAVCLTMLLLTSCGRNMAVQPKAQAFEASPYFSNGAVNQPLIENTVSRERGNIDPAFYTGQGPNGFLAEVPLPVTQELLERGQERYNIYCAPCHNFSGNGEGMIVQKGFPQPASFHEQRLRDQPVGYYFNAITNGFGRMYSYASRVPAEDRWAISAYIKALQLSQNASIDDIPEEQRSQLESEADVTTMGASQ